MKTIKVLVLFVVCACLGHAAGFLNASSTFSDGYVVCYLSELNSPYVNSGCVVINGRGTYNVEVPNGNYLLTAILLDSSGVELNRRGPSSVNVNHTVNAVVSVSRTGDIAFHSLVSAATIPEYFSYSDLHLWALLIALGTIFSVWAGLTAFRK